MTSDDTNRGSRRHRPRRPGRSHSEPSHGDTPSPSHSEPSDGDTPSHSDGEHAQPQ